MYFLMDLRGRRCILAFFVRRSEISYHAIVGWALAMAPGWSLNTSLAQDKPKQKAAHKMDLLL